ncbi:MAG: translation elongation factor 4 [Chloroflexota bacterium]|nr:translation elongation factor 4 [Chloroflexota bacterium]
MLQDHIRNFCIIAHIDHGKSTLADRFMQLTGTVSEREMVEQLLDSMDLEREKGITIKARAVRMQYQARNGERYELNLIDTPGHVDFSYEVSRSLAACEGAILVVDATQGIQAQTLANVYLALDSDLEIVPVINKIDLPSADVEAVSGEIERVVGLPREDVIPVSAKLGTGAAEVLEAVVQRVPPPSGEPQKPLRALIFDSHYDAYKGVIAYLRVIDGCVRRLDRIRMMASGAVTEAAELGFFDPDLTASDALDTGEVGYIATGLKVVSDCRVGDTITLERHGATEPLTGYEPAKPMVFAGIFPVAGEDYPLLRDALDKLKLNDAALVYEPETSAALGFGFRAGFLGLLHMEIVQERLEREYDLDLLITAPSVEYHVRTTDGATVAVRSPTDMPPPQRIQEITEPWMAITIVTPTAYIGAIMDMVSKRRGEFLRMEYLEEHRVMLTYHVPLSEIVAEFYDQLKSRTQGYASLDYSLQGYRPANLVKLDILVNGQPVDALSLIVHRDEAYQRGRMLVDKLRELIPRQLFEVPIQAAIGNKVISRETIRAIRKNVLAKCYGGDVTRKRKLLEKQKAGKARMKTVGNVQIPQEAFMAVLRLNEEEEARR